MKTNNLIRTGWMLLYFLSPLLPMGAIYFSHPKDYPGFSEVMPMILGACAFTWLTWQFVLISRAKFIEKYFAMDRFYRVHGWMAVFSLVLVFLHKNLENDWASAAEYGDNAFDVFLIISAITLLVMVNNLLHRFKFFSWIRKTLTRFKVFRYQYMKLIHNVTVIGLFFMFIHVLMTYSARTYPIVKYVFIAYFTIGFGFYLYHQVIRRFLTASNKYTIQDVVQESPSMWTVKLHPQNGEAVLHAPGQFGFFRFYKSRSVSDEHPFSISSSGADKDGLSVTIKALGDFTSTVNQYKKGDQISIDAPYGKFSYLCHPEEVSTVLIAGGVGITPMMSMIRYMGQFDKERRATLIWGVNTREDLISKEEMESIQKNMKNLKIVPVMFRDETWEGEKGIINREKIEKILKEHHGNADQGGFYICGPGIMLDNTVKALKAIGIPKKRIHFEKFSL